MSTGEGILSKEILIEWLEKVVCSNYGATGDAEANMKALSLMSPHGFGVLLIDVVIDPNVSLSVRLLALQYLRVHATTLFCVWNRRLELPPVEIKPEMKQKIKDSLLLGLQDPISEIRTAIAHVISDIAYADWPKNWPNLYITLIDCMTKEVRFSIDGGMQVFLNAAESKSPSAIADPAILQVIARIFAGSSNYLEKHRSQAVNLFTNIVDTCEGMFVQQHLQPAIPMFCEKFIEILSEQPNLTSDSYGLKANIVKAITTLIQNIPRCVFTFLPRILSVIRETLIHNTKDYHENNMSREVENAGGFTNDIDNLLKAILEFIQALTSRPNKQGSGHSEYDLPDQYWVSLQHSLSPNIFHHLITFMKVADERIQEWQDESPSAFLTDEEGLGYAKGLRSIVGELVISIGSCPEKSAANALLVAILVGIETQNTMHVSRNSEPRTDWKLHEAYLLALCLVKDIIIDKLNKGTLYFDIRAFLENVVLVDLQNPESHPLLIGRCLCLGGLYAEQMTPEIASRFLEATAAGLKNQLSVTSRLLAAVAVKRWFRVAAIEGNDSYKEILKPHLAVLFQGLFDLVASSSSEHIIELVLNNIYLLALYHKAFRIPTGDEIYSLTVAMYVKSHQICDINTVFKKLFLECSVDEKYATLFQICWLPMFVDMMTNDCTEKSEQSDNSEKTGLHYILQSFILITVDGIACETARLLIEKMGNTLPFDVLAMKYLLTATKYHKVNSVLHCRLLIIWSHLIVNQTDDVLNFLSTAPTCKNMNGGEKEALTFVIGDGLYAKYKFFDPVQRKAVVSAFCKILEYGMTHPEFQMLRCTVIQETEDAKTPFLVKLCKLITNEWSTKVSWNLE